MAKLTPGDNGPLYRPSTKHRPVNRCIFISNNCNSCKTSSCHL